MAVSSRCAVHPVCAAVPQERHIADLDGDVTGPRYSFRIPFESTTTITVTQVELARLLFDGQSRRVALMHAEVEEEPPLPLDGAEEARLQRVLDVMWNKTAPEIRKLAERRAERVFAAARASR